MAICDQLEDPKGVKGIVKRGVTELVTPGLSFNDNVLDKRHNNYLASLFYQKDDIGISFLDLSTGEFLTAQGNVGYIDKLIQSFNPSEIIFSKGNRDQFYSQFKEAFNTYQLDDWIFAFDYAQERLTTHFGTANLKGFGIEEYELGIIASGAILYYLEETEHREINHIASISRLEEDKYVWLDKFTIRNLELPKTRYFSREGSLYRRGKYL